MQAWMGQAGLVLGVGVAIAVGCAPMGALCGEGWLGVGCVWFDLKVENEKMRCW